ncbi:MAG: hypothetical protein KatS3mg076_2563 [Candidatus Binatia bacterium]|nr:MAG: hypothetical protein KatS3mg076_2563 [Candidatus Binatia bacterium]
MLYLHEIIDIVGTGQEPYLDTVGERARHSEQEGISRLAGSWKVVGSTNRWPRVVNLWEMDGWSAVGAKPRAAIPPGKKGPRARSLVGAGHRVAERWVRPDSRADHLLAYPLGARERRVTGVGLLPFAPAPSAGTQVRLSRARGERAQADSRGAGHPALRRLFLRHAERRGHRALGGAGFRESLRLLRNSAGKRSAQGMGGKSGYALGTLRGHVARSIAPLLFPPRDVKVPCRLTPRTRRSASLRADACANGTGDHPGRPAGGSHRPPRTRRSASLRVAACADGTGDHPGRPAGASHRPPGRDGARPSGWPRARMVPAIIQDVRPADPTAPGRDGARASTMGAAFRRWYRRATLCRGRVRGWYRRSSRTSGRRIPPPPPDATERVPAVPPRRASSGSFLDLGCWGGGTGGVVSEGGSPPPVPDERRGARRGGNRHRWLLLPWLGGPRCTYLDVRGPC